LTNFCTKCGTKANPGVKFCTSCGNKLTNEPEVKDKDGLTASERAIVDSIDYDKIASEAAANAKVNQSQIVANAQKTASKKNRNAAIFGLVMGILFIITGFISLNLGLGIYFLIAGFLSLVFAGFVFVVSRQNAKAAEEHTKQS